MRHLRLMALAGLLLIGPGTLRAADNLPAKMTLADAVRTALGTNASLDQAEEGRLSALSSLRIAGFATSLSLGSTAGLGVADSVTDTSGRIFGGFNYKGLNGSEAAVTLAPLGIGSQRGAIDLSYRQPLLKGKGKLSQKSNLLLGAKSAVSIQNKELYQSRQSVVQSVIESYFSAVMAREQVKVQEHAVALAKEIADGTRKRAEAQLIAENEVPRAELQVALGNIELNQTQKSARAAVDRLLLAIGTGIGQLPELVDTVPEAGLETPPIEECVKTALANRSELAVYDDRLSDKERELAVANDSLRPDVAMVAGFNYSRSDAGMLTGTLFNKGALTAGFDIRFPLDSRVSQEERNTTARGLMVLRKQLVYQKERIAGEVNDAYRAVEQARSSMDIYGKNLKVAEENLYLEQLKVEEGLNDNRDVLTAQDRLTQVESGLLSAKIGLYLANMNLRHAMGDDLTKMVLK